MLGIKRKSSAQMTLAGAVNSIFPAEMNLGSQKLTEVWSGTIGLSRPLNKKVDQLIEPDVLEKYFTQADITSPMRCIDGRILDGWDKNKKLRNRPLGVQLPGGTPAAALVNRIIMMGDVGGPNLTLDEDLKDTVKKLAKHNFYYGGHIDEHNEKHRENTGCGAIDKMPEILAKIVSPKSFREIKHLSQVLLGDLYDDHIANEVVGRLILLQADSESYFKYDKKRRAFLYKKLVIETMRKSANRRNPIEKLVGPHNEKALVINFVADTTFDRDRFSQDNNNEIQMFNYDGWADVHSAKAIYPGRGKDSQRRRLEYIICRTMYAVATCMVLTDGSLKLVVRR